MKSLPTSLNSLLSRSSKEEESFEYLFFWGHQENDPNGIFSQWYPSPFQDLDGIFYPTAEHFMMIGKAKVFNDVESLNAIFDTEDPRAAKKIGRQVRNFNPMVWNMVCRDIVSMGNFYKFTQNKDLLDKLLVTQGKILVEASPYDSVWGIGMKSDEEGVLDPNNWKGTNYLGFVLTNLRDGLLSEA